MNGVRILAALALTLVAAMSWRNVLMRVEMNRRADAAILQAAADTGVSITPENVPKFRDFVIPRNTLSFAVLLPPAIVTTLSSALAWALAIYAIRRAERREAAG